ncbi:MAG: UDP-N-acetylmuramoyl-tripeptide--D-alanyl-D-alanine ligase [Rhodanobacteraceae bacterium]|jgi:UDP-N-acetylmuramoyl-tripeptide--D-alanyl-D-alanine ligase|nr:MAG: UDP-N-acetylmuramoyl-tripeptide--D-alanyl-D-alanine ligase [Rhodanobacteraceae bacterium]
MLSLRLKEIAVWTRGVLQGADAGVCGVSTDSRTIKAGELFVALIGDTHDGHDHVADAVARGAAGAIVSRRVDADISQIVVADTLHALGDLASAVRAQRDVTVIGITGSNGKTSVKALTARILARHGKTHSNSGSFNNEIGLPLTLLAMPEDTGYAVLEMGAGKPGDIAYLASIARPRIGLVNNIAPAHLERMRTLEGIAETKGAMYQALPSDGVAVINADDAFAMYFTGLAGSRRKLRFGLDAEADVSATDIALDANGSRFTLKTPAGNAQVHLPLPGRHNVANAAAAAALALAVDVPLDTIVAGLQEAEAVGGRLLRRESPQGWTLFDDSYNANPGSALAAVATLALQPGERWLVLGNMGELGPDAAALHADIGRAARERGIARLYAVGALAANAAEAFGADARVFADQPALVASLRRDLHANVSVLVKGSHASHMERVVAALLDDDKGDGRHAA